MRIWLRQSWLYKYQIAFLYFNMKVCFSCIQDGSGKIDFREYVIGCALVTQPANTEDTIRMAFKVSTHHASLHPTPTDIFACMAMLLPSQPLLPFCLFYKEYIIVSKNMWL